LRTGLGGKRGKRRELQGSAKKSKALKVMQRKGREAAKKLQSEVPFARGRVLGREEGSGELSIEREMKKKNRLKDR